MSAETPAPQPPHAEAIALAPQPYAHPYTVYAASRPKASGMRIATGVVALVVAVFGILHVAVRLFTRGGMGPSTPYVGWMNFLLLVGAVGCFVTGIVILAKQRKRAGATPWLVGSFAALMIFGCLGLNSLPDNGTPGGQAILIPCSFAVVILAALVLILEKARRRQYRA